MGRVSVLLVSAIAQLAALGGVGVLAEPAPLLSRGAAPKVDLGYAVYQGAYDSASRLNVFKGYAS